MSGSLADALRNWHDFYVLIGTAAATLVGLMFVAASIGASYFTVEREHGLHNFLTPTVLHFTATLVACLIVIAPNHGRLSLGIILLVGSVFGLGYSGRRWLVVRRRKYEIDLADHLWYLVGPLTSYVAIAAAAGLVLFLADSELGLDLLSAALVLLLLLGIRNAWDMTTWIAVRAPSPARDPSPAGAQ
jgi:hypothetical protein